ncbi:MAG: cyclodeaminase/cyclohydrolase family protein [Methylococcales bacterium]|nr:cyclodeaminase/cyclohydrolase family protein [Methylococcales bacterium]
MEIKDKSIEVFLDELASKAATPGGGSAAALMGAQSAALTSMVCHLTIGKAKYAAVDLEMKALLVKSEKLREELTIMIKEDVEVFDRIMACYRLPKKTDEEKLKRSEAIQGVLKEATLVPLKCVRACAHAIALNKIAADKGSLNVISDAGVGVMSAYAGLKSAALTIYINTGNIKDKTFTEAVLSELDDLLEGIDGITNDIYQRVKDQL